MSFCPRYFLLCVLWFFIAPVFPDNNAASCIGRNGAQGECIFTWECRNQGRVVLSTCLRGYLFGACCEVQSASSSPPMKLTTTKTTPSTIKTTTLKAFPTKYPSLGNNDILDTHSQTSVSVDSTPSFVHQELVTYMNYAGANRPTPYQNKYSSFPEVIQTDSTQSSLETSSQNPIRGVSVPPWLITNPTPSRPQFTPEAPATVINVMMEESVAISMDNQSISGSLSHHPSMNNHHNSIFHQPITIQPPSNIGSLQLTTPLTTTKLPIIDYPFILGPFFRPSLSTIPASNNKTHPPPFSLSSSNPPSIQHLGMSHSGAIPPEKAPSSETVPLITRLPVRIPRPTTTTRHPTRPLNKTPFNTKRPLVMAHPLRTSTTSSLWHQSKHPTKSSLSHTISSSIDLPEIVNPEKYPLKTVKPVTSSSTVWKILDVQPTTTISHLFTQIPSQTNISFTLLRKPVTTTRYVLPTSTSLPTPFDTSLLSALYPYFTFLTKPTATWPPAAPNRPNDHMSSGWDVLRPPPPRFQSTTPTRKYGVSTTRRIWTPVSPTTKKQEIQNTWLYDRWSAVMNKSDVSVVNSTKPSVRLSTVRAWDYKRECGVRPLALNGRIVGGSKSTFGQWPWQALVKETGLLGFFTKNKCGGVLVNKQYVLTAAHCKAGFLKSFIVVLGEYDLAAERQALPVVERNVRRIYPHPDFLGTTFESDLAVLELEKPVDFQPHIVPICLPTEDQDFTGKVGIASGFGRLNSGGRHSTVLNYVAVPILSKAACQEMFKASLTKVTIKESYLCAGFKEGGRDSCEGDSGGPLAVEGPDGRWVLAGIVSNGIKCALPNSPGIYTKISHFVKWVKQMMT